MNAWLHAKLPLRQPSRRKVKLRQGGRFRPHPMRRLRQLRSHLRNSLFHLLQRVNQWFRLHPQLSRRNLRNLHPKPPRNRRLLRALMRKLQDRKIRKINSYHERLTHSSQAFVLFAPASR